jgi:hypothetical protein
MRHSFGRPAFNSLKRNRIRSEASDSAAIGRTAAQGSTYRKLGFLDQINSMKTISSLSLVRTVLIVTVFLASAVGQGLLAADPSMKGKPATKPAIHSSSNDEVHFNIIDGQPIRSSSGQ